MIYDDSTALRRDSAKLKISWLLSIFVAAFLSPSVFTFIVSTLLGMRLDSSFLVLPAVTISVLVGMLAYLKPDDLFKTVPLILIVTFYLVTGAWSPSAVYWWAKSLHTVTIVPVSFMAGLVISKIDRDFTTLFWSILVIASAALALSLVFGIEQISAYSTFGQDASGPGYQSLSRYFGLGIITAVLLAISSRNLLVRIALMILAIAMFVQMLSSGGRTGIAITGVFFTVYFFSIAKPIVRLAVVAFVLIVALFVLQTDYQYLIDELAKNDSLPRSITRVLYYWSSASEQSNDVSRQYLKQLALEEWQSWPFFGVGWGGFPVVGGLGDEDGLYPHNLVLELLSETGGFGLFIFSIYNVHLIHTLWRDTTVYRRNRVILFSLYCACLTIALTIMDFSFQRELFLTIGLVVGSCASRRRRSSSRKLPSEFQGYERLDQISAGH